MKVSEDSFPNQEGLDFPVDRMSCNAFPGLFSGVLLEPTEDDACSLKIKNSFLDLKWA